ncbi:uncharacterized protein AB675_8390 [Cyphellophora attinorum]|uniref:BHLH domain-containing protein n=1 Tax=Cyphellophora attinorum TaxID=1664694 RepID=A0A0N0NR55_9EURO|nr:uncharacterized protein AB675_8390 [Phialophora attinorum]KPI44439.1 hypothetical protein AB675_8390 [Phialophora attinorum]
MSTPDSEASGSPPSETQSTAPTQSKKKQKPSKARLTSEQKNTNHRDAENKRREGIHIQQEALSKLIPGAENDAKSEERLLTKTADYLEESYLDIRRMIAECDAKGIPVPDEIRHFLKDDDFGGPNWKTPNMDAYEAKKQKAEAKKVKPNGRSVDKSASPDDD